MIRLRSSLLAACLVLAALAPGSAQVPPDRFLDHPLDDYRWVIRQKAGLDQAITDWCIEFGKETDCKGGVIASATIEHIHWRRGYEFTRWEEELGDPLTLRKLLEWQWPRGLPPIDYNHDFVRCNFLAMPAPFEMGDCRDCSGFPSAGLWFPTWDAAERAQYLDAAQAQGVAYVPFTVQPTQGTTLSPAALANVQVMSAELRDRGMGWLHFLTTDRQPQMDVAATEAWLRWIIPRTDAPHVFYVIAWEMPNGDIYHWTGDDHLTMDMIRLIRSLIPSGRKIGLHFLPRWWGGTGNAGGIDGGGYTWEGPFWEAALEAGATTLLYQSEWDARTEVGSDDRVFKWLAHYDNGDGILGILGRGVRWGFNVIWYEQSRFWVDWQRRVTRYLALDRGQGYC